MPTDHADRSTDRLERLVGHVVGLCRRPTHGLWAPGEPRMGCLSVQGEAAEPDRADPSFRSWGYHADADALRASALGEAVERYSQMDIDDRGARYASVAELERGGVAHIAPARLLSLPPGTRRQGELAEVPADDDTVQWLEGVDLRTGDAILLPGVYCVFYPDEPGNPLQDEGAWYWATSNGTATGTGPTEACLSGLFELLERDAFMLLWYHRLRFPRLVPDPSSRLAHWIGAALSGSRVEYRLIDLTEVHGVPTVVAAVRGSAVGGVLHGIGAGTAGTTAEAVWRAVKEACSFYSMQRRGLLSQGRRTTRADQVRSFPGHADYYMTVEHHDDLDLFFEDRPSRSVESGPRDGSDEPAGRALRREVERLNARGIDLYAVDLTPPEMAQAGLFTYKVVSPQLIPLDVDHRSRHLGIERLLTEPTRRGWRPDRPALVDLNHAPHPFT
ncbi:thiazole/oxazole-forming peptide maturase SagD family component [Nocardiopsis sp. Huas11]|uniref:YcaO-like family protein n=1 Tax=Nocardiopsis sp. Huas11 TaxID=2183912 RepID=UPI000EB39764|nr:YcaO-like family protein [Nocardiopsis sp. Huas11]RKS09262.1 thiazole/oxazole-forming peptide maturase SagD family component [Nocardiopsis sp. Huas11]